MPSKNIKTLIEKIQKDGPDKLHVLADFDRTLTTAFANGKKVVSLVSLLRDHNYLTPDYPAKAMALFNKYHPLEQNHHLSKNDRKKAMQRWWTKHFDLLIESKLSKKTLEKAMSSDKVKLRAGTTDFINLLYKNNIPLIIMSASGLGVESVAYYLKNKKLLKKNIYIISNNFIWNKRGQAVGVKQPIIHSLNKHEVLVKHFPIYKKIKNRKNVILLGDQPYDVDMIVGFDYDNIIKIGFLNEHPRKYLTLYKKTFDLVIKNDGPMDEVNKIIKTTIKQWEALTIKKQNTQK
jgi:cytosolic 5'-nucleotidase 3